MISIVNKTVFANPTQAGTGSFPLAAPSTIGNWLIIVTNMYGDISVAPGLVLTTDQGELFTVGQEIQNIANSPHYGSSAILMLQTTMAAASIAFTLRAGNFPPIFASMIVYEVSGYNLEFYGHGNNDGNSGVTSFTTDSSPNPPTTNALFVLSALTDRTFVSATPPATETDILPDTGNGCQVRSSLLVNVTGINDITYTMGASGDLYVPLLIFVEPPILGTLSERNFACNGCFESTSAYGDVLKSLALSMAGFVVPPGDCWRIYAGSYVPPLVSLADGDCRSAIKGDFRLSSRDTCNGVKGQYIPAFLPINPLGPLASSPASPAWKKTDFPPVQRANYIAEDGGVILWKDIQLDFTTSLWMAQRIARIVLERLRRQITISLPAKLTGLQALAADTISFIHARWNSVVPPVPTVFQIAHTALRMESQADGVPAFGVDLVLRQTDALVYEFAPPTSPANFGDYSPYGQTGVGAGNVE